MAFSTRRGRPPRMRLDTTDHGTPELQFKRALGVTSEPIDLCLERKLISPDQHWCSLHLRWLYTLRYGAPVVTTRYADKDGLCLVEEDASAWRTLREREYNEAISQLKRAKRYEPVMRVCVFNELPAFLNQPLIERAWRIPALLTELERIHQQLIQGLDVLANQWRPKHNSGFNCKIGAEILAKKSPQKRHLN